MYNAMDAISAFGAGRDFRTTQNVGQALGRGDYQGAQQAAFQGGQIGTGLQIGNQREQMRAALAQEAAEADEQRREMLGGLYRDIGQVANALQSIPVEQRGQALMSVAGRFGQYGATPDQIQQYAQALSDPNTSDAVLAALQSAAVDADEIFKANAPVTLNQGDQRVRLRGGREMVAAENIDEVGQQNAATRQGELGVAQGRLGLDRARFEADQAGARGPDIEREEAVRGEAEDALGSFRDIEESYARVIASANEPSAAGDLALIFNYMKMLDPGSAVRETEFANAQNAGGVPDRIRSLFNNVRRGQRLSAQQRRDFFDRAQRLYGGQRALAEDRLSLFEEQVNDEGLRPQFALPRFMDFSEAAGGVDLGGGASADGPIAGDGRTVEDILNQYGGG